MKLAKLVLLLVLAALVSPGAAYADLRDNDFPSFVPTPAPSPSPIATIGGAPAATPNATTAGSQLIVTDSGVPVPDFSFALGAGNDVFVTVPGYSPRGVKVQPGVTSVDVCKIPEGYTRDDVNALWFKNTITGVLEPLAHTCGKPLVAIPMGAWSGDELDYLRNATSYLTFTMFHDFHVQGQGEVITSAVVPVEVKIDAVMASRGGMESHAIGPDGCISKAYIWVHPQAVHRPIYLRHELVHAAGLRHGNKPGLMSSVDPREEWHPDELALAIKAIKLRLPGTTAPDNDPGVVAPAAALGQ